MLSVAVGQNGVTAFTRGIKMYADIPALIVSLFVGTLCYGIVITGYIASCISCVGGTALWTLPTTRCISWYWLSSSTGAISVTGEAAAPQGHATVVGAVLAEGHVTTNACFCIANTHISAFVLLRVAYFGLWFLLLADNLMGIIGIITVRNVKVD